MPKVNVVEKARKAIPSAGIKVGDKYYWWKFRYGGKRVSKTYPKQSQLTNSPFLSTVYEFGERLSELSSSQFDEPDALKGWVDDLKSEIEELRDEQEEKRNNMPEGLQDAPTGELLQERYDYLEEMYNDLDNVDLEDYEEPSDDELRAAAISQLYSIDDEEEADQEEKEQIDENEVEEAMNKERKQKLEEWLDDKIGELSSISYNGS